MKNNSTEKEKQALHQNPREVIKSLLFMLDEGSRERTFESYSPSTEDGLLQRSANVLRNIRLVAANWDNYPDAKELLADLIDKGY